MSNGAVGLFGSENNDFNAVYFGLLLLGFSGALVARFQSKGMTYVLSAMAVAQMGIAVAAIIMGQHELPESSVTEILGVNFFFAVFWITASLLFRQAAVPFDQVGNQR